MQKMCRKCKQIKVIDQFYIRSGIDTPTEPGHYISECIECMKNRSRHNAHLDAAEPRALSEQLAIDYLKRNKIPAVPGKAYLAADVDVMAWGIVRVEVKYSGLRLYQQHFAFGLTKKQQREGLLADVIMLICDYPSSAKGYYFFSPDDPVFYFKDGRRKGGFIFTPGQQDQKKHHQNRTILTEPLMEQHQDAIQFIEEARLRLSQAL